MLPHHTQVLWTRWDKARLDESQPLLCHQPAFEGGQVMPLSEPQCGWMAVNGPPD